jgi:hypothetical protein
MRIKKKHLIGTRTRDLPAYSIVSQPSTLPRICRLNEKHLKKLPPIMILSLVGVTIDRVWIGDWIY